MRYVIENITAIMLEYIIAFVQRLAYISWLQILESMKGRGYKAITLIRTTSHVDVSTKLSNEAT